MREGLSLGAKLKLQMTLFTNRQKTPPWLPPFDGGMPKIDPNSTSHPLTLS